MKQNWISLSLSFSRKFSMLKLSIRGITGIWDSVISLEMNSKGFWSLNNVPPFCAQNPFAAEIPLERRIQFRRSVLGGNCNKGRLGCFWRVESIYEMLIKGQLYSERKVFQLNWSFGLLSCFDCIAYIFLCFFKCFEVIN